MKQRKHVVIVGGGEEALAKARLIAQCDTAIRIVLTPKSRNVDPELLKESLFKLTDLETRFSLNLNVLDTQPGFARAPLVMGLKELLDSWTRAQIDILQRRAQHRLDKIAARLELVRGYIIAYLNLDRVIEIIRTEDEPKPLMMKEFDLTDRQVEAILNMRLRSLRKLEEMELRREQDELLAEEAELQALLDSPAKQRTRLKRDLKSLRKDYGEDTALGRRRTLDLRLGLAAGDILRHTARRLDLVEHGLGLFDQFGGQAFDII